MSEARKQILELVAAGRLNIEEAERLLDALREKVTSHERADKVVSIVQRPKKRKLRIQLERNGELEFKINVSSDLLKTGMRLVDLIPGYLRDSIDEALRAKGARFRVATLNPERVDEFIDLLDGAALDVGAGAEVRFLAEAI
ncbi:MAG: hypothetical protein K0U93_14325 [Gammaproteobacteria bacterium]|nr:hypothetical protein [Gammaproteobacteria bacterium]